MEQYELGRGLPGLSIATLMELLDDNIEPHRQAGRARTGRRRQGPSVCPGRPASYAIGALCSSGTGIPLVGVALLAD